MQGPRESKSAFLKMCQKKKEKYNGIQKNRHNARYTQENGSQEKADL
jgi:hypothetical protein